MRKRLIILISSFLFASLTWGQQSSPQGMPGMDMPGHDMASMKDTPMANDDTGANAARSMEGHMDMGPHMKMTALRSSRAGDAERSQRVVESARRVSEKYMDYHAALADGYKVFLPNVTQKMYHFTNYAYAMEAAFRFNPEHPTSLLYEKHGDDYQLIGVMYTAPKRFSEEQLDERIPLSVAQWHEHVNLCAPPSERKREVLLPHPQFGLKGSISTPEACEAAGGKFRPVVFNWMVHLYPLEKDEASIWSVQRQHSDGD